jgi:hypothetical protein
MATKNVVQKHFVLVLSGIQGPGWMKIRIRDQHPCLFRRKITKTIEESPNFKPKKRRLKCRN